ncbi:MAG: GntR family transcriptional regulator [Pseudomonadota bacterium]
MDRNAPNDETALLLGHPMGATVQLVVDTLFARIKSGAHPADSRLPSERALAAEMRVARNTVREALDVLESHGVIRRRAGSGSFVTWRSDQKPRLSTEAVADETSPLDHLVVRGIFEPEIVRLAVVNMPPRKIADIGRLVTEFDTVSNDVDAFMALEDKLLMQLSEGTGNALLASCYRLALETAAQGAHTDLRRRALTPRRIDDARKRYTVLHAAIAARDVAQAVEFVKLNLVEEHNLLLQDG